MSSVDVYFQRDIAQALRSASYSGQQHDPAWQAALVAVALAFGIQPEAVIYSPPETVQPSRLESPAEHYGR